MIVEAVFNFIFLIIIGVINLFPTFPTIDTSTLDGVFMALSLVDSFISLKVVVMCMVVFFIIANLEIIWAGIMWVVKKIPGVE